MRRFAEKRRTRRLLYSKASVALLAIVLLLLARSVWGVYKKERLAREARQAAVREFETMETRKNSLEAELKKLDTEEGVEAELREKFQVAKPGEQVLILLDEEKKIQ